MPILKKGKHDTPDNYRPVSLTSIACKIMETVIREGVMGHMKRNNILLYLQHGFIRGRSCSAKLLAGLDEWTRALEDVYNIDVIYLDFTKAFDTVPHHRPRT